jgi:nuclear GTP-binding protein
MILEQDFMKELEKNKSKHQMIKEGDIERLVVEDNGKVTTLIEENFDKKKAIESKYDAKRELNSIITKSDVIIQVIDARDPLNYRSKELEKNVEKMKEKKLIIILNKVDLVSSENAETWGKFIRRDIPCVLFSASPKFNHQTAIDELNSIITAITTHLINKKVHVGLVGYPNTGKSEIIKILKSKFGTLYKSNSLPGYNEIGVNDTIRVFDKPGFIYSKNETGALMPKTAKNSEDIKTPMDVVKNILSVIPHDVILETYEVSEFEEHVEFLENVARHRNLLIKVCCFFVFASIYFI